MEKEFEKFCKIKQRMTKLNYINNDYFLENKDKGYSFSFKDKDFENKILHIHGNADGIVSLKV